jgi:hypothetical protein
MYIILIILLKCTNMGKSEIYLFPASVQKRDPQQSTQYTPHYLVYMRNTVFKLHEKNLLQEPNTNSK